MTDLGGVYQPYRKLRYHQGDDEGYIIATSNFLHPEACRTIITFCEEHVDHEMNTAPEMHHPWRARGHGVDTGVENGDGGESVAGAKTYVYATVDLEVDRVPRLRKWLRSMSFVERVARRIERSHGVRITAFDDVFVVKYHDSSQRELVRHVDGGDVSFMVALNPGSNGNHPPTSTTSEEEKPSLLIGGDSSSSTAAQEATRYSGTRGEYTGGGTQFDVLANDPPLQLRQGEVVTFDAHLYHRGVPITGGTRYLLVGFCHTHSSAANEDGNVNLDLTLVVRTPAGSPHDTKTEAGHAVLPPPERIEASTKKVPRKSCVVSVGPGAKKKSSKRAKSKAPTEE